MSLSDVAIVTVGGNDYRIHFWVWINLRVLDRIKRAHLSEKSGQL